MTTFAQPLTPPEELTRFKVLNALIDSATGLSLLIALLSSLAARQTPAPVRTLSYASFMSLCIVQAIRAGSAGVTRRHVVSDAVDQAQLIASNRQVMHQQRVAGLQFNLQDRNELLRQIDAIPNQRDQVVAIKQLGLATGELGAIVANYEAKHGIVPVVSLMSGAPTAQTLTVTPQAAESVAQPTVPARNRNPNRNPSPNPQSPAQTFREDKPVPTAFEGLTIRDAAADYLKGYQNLIIAGESGTGKSNFILRVIEQAIEQGQKVYILDAKNSAIYNYVRDKYPQQIQYLECGGELGHEDALNRIDYLLEQMMDRDDASPDYRDILVIIDEYNIILDAGVETKIPSGERTYSAATKARMRKLMNQGRTRQHRVVITSHTTDANALGTKNASYQMLALARCGDFSSVDSFLSSYHGDDKKRVAETVGQLRDVIDDVPIAVMSIPKAGAYKLPYSPRDGQGYPLSNDVTAIADALATDSDPNKGLDIAGALTYLREKYQEQNTRNIAPPSAMAFFQELDQLTPDYDLSPYFEWAPHLVELVSLDDKAFADALDELLS